MLKKIFIKSMLLLQFLLIISCKVNLGKIEKPGDQGEKEVLIQSVVLKPSKTTVEPGESIDVFALQKMRGINILTGLLNLFLILMQLYKNPICHWMLFLFLQTSLLNV